MAEASAPNVLPDSQKNIYIAGATPKFTKSARESNSAPSLELAFSKRAIRPSMPSQTQAISKAHNASRKRPSLAKAIDVMPAQAARDVTRLGTIARNGTRSARSS